MVRRRIIALKTIEDRTKHLSNTDVIKNLANNFVIDYRRARLLLMLCCVLCYAGTLRNGYALDDDFSFYENQYVEQGIAGIPDILTHPYFSNATLTADYRPVAGITFAVEKQLFGNNPHISHFVNMLLYIVCVLLIFALLTEVFALAVPLAFIIALFFAVHPVHTEVVASIKNREELLSLIFSTLAFISAYRLFAGSRKTFYTILTFVFLLLSFASKMSNIPVSAIILVYLYFRGYHRQSRLFYPVGAMVMIFSALYFLAVYHITNRPIFDLENPLVLYNDLSPKIGTTAVSLFFYFRFMWVPWPLSFFYGYNTIPVTTADQPLAVLSIFLHAALFIYGALLFFRKKITGFFIVAYFIAMTVYCNLVILYTGIVSERALFAPSLWFIAAIFCFLYDWLSRPEEAKVTLSPELVPVVIAALWFSIYGVLTINRAAEWKDTITLMQADIPHLANSTLANYFYANNLKARAEEQSDTLLRSRYMTEAKKYYHCTISASPAYPYGYLKLGLIFRYYNYVPDSAYYYFSRAYQLNPDLADVDYQYGRAEYEFGDVNRAAHVFANLYRKMPGDTFTIFYHALLLMKTGHPAEGHVVNSFMMAMAPGLYQPYFNEGLYYQLTGDTINAAHNYETSLTLGCTDQGVYHFLIDYYQKQRRADDANRLLGLLR